MGNKYYTNFLLAGIPKPTKLEKEAAAVALSILSLPIIGAGLGAIYSYFSDDHDYNTNVPLFSGALSVIAGVGAKLILEPPWKKSSKNVYH